MAAHLKLTYTPLAQQKDTQHVRAHTQTHTHTPNRDILHIPDRYTHTHQTEINRSRHTPHIHTPDRYTYTTHKHTHTYHIDILNTNTHTDISDTHLSHILL